MTLNFENFTAYELARLLDAQEKRIVALGIQNIGLLHGNIKVLQAISRALTTATNNGKFA